MNVFSTGMLAIHVATASNELTAKRAEDSMSIVAIDLYNPVTPAENPIAARTFLTCRESRTTIMRVRRRLRESEIERCAGLVQTLVIPHSLA